MIVDLQRKNLICFCGPSERSLFRLRHRNLLGTINNRGARYNNDIFSVAKYSKFVIRAPEFAKVDRAVNASVDFERYKIETDYADRFWHTDQRATQPDKALKSRLILFDCKSTITRYAKNQFYIISLHQRRKVAFYLGIYAVDPSFIELIPNFYQEASLNL